MALPYLDNPATLDEMTVQELDGLVAKLNSFLSQQHNAQGGHGAVTADSLTLANGGIFTIKDEDGVPTTLSRTRALGTKFDIKGRPDNTNPVLSIRYQFGTEAFVTLVRVGMVGRFGAGLGPGVQFGALNSAYNDWAANSYRLSTGPSWILQDMTNNQRVMCVVWAFNDHYEIRPETFGPDVWLGGNAPGQHYNRAYIDAVHEQGRAVAMGDWQDVPYNAADFTASAGATWGVDAADVPSRRFSLIGQTMHYHFTITTSNVGGAAPAELLITLPTGYTAPRDTNFTYFLLNAGVALILGRAYVLSGTNVVHLQPGLSGGTWTPTAGNNTYVLAALTFEVTG